MKSASALFLVYFQGFIDSKDALSIDILKKFRHSGMQYVLRKFTHEAWFDAPFVLSHLIRGLIRLGFPFFKLMAQ